MYQKMVDTDIPFFYDPIGTGADPSLSMRTTGNLVFEPVYRQSHIKKWPLDL